MRRLLMQMMLLLMCDLLAENDEREWEVHEETSEEDQGLPGSPPAAAMVPASGQSVRRRLQFTDMHMDT